MGFYGGRPSIASLTLNHKPDECRRQYLGLGIRIRIHSPLSLLEGSWDLVST